MEVKLMGDETGLASFIPGSFVLWIWQISQTCAAFTC